MSPSLLLGCCGREGASRSCFYAGKNCKIQVGLILSRRSLFRAFMVSISIITNPCHAKVKCAKHIAAAGTRQAGWGPRLCTRTHYRLGNEANRERERTCRAKEEESHNPIMFIGDSGAGRVASFPRKSPSIHK